MGTFPQTGKWPSRVCPDIQAWETVSVRACVSVHATKPVAEAWFHHSFWSTSVWIYYQKRTKQSAPGWARRWQEDIRKSIVFVRESLELRWIPQTDTSKINQVIMEVGFGGAVHFHSSRMGESCVTWFPQGGDVVSLAFNGSRYIWGCMKYYLRGKEADFTLLKCVDGKEASRLRWLHVLMLIITQHLWSAML